jgi:sugar lactone lactonase YvrE
MAVHSSGRAYIGNFGYDFVAGETPRPTALVKVEPSGETGTVGDRTLVCPNGIAIDEQRGRLIVAETFAHRLTAFDIGHDGGLQNRRIFATFDNEIDPDGICLDAEGQVWLATAKTSQVLRVAEGGEVTARVELGSGCISYAVALGGDDRRTLFVAASTGVMPTETPGGRIEIARVDVPGVDSSAT